jgi:hypothetical protein
MKKHAAEPLMSEPSPVEDISVAKLKNYKSPGSYRIPAKLIQAGGEMLHPQIHKLIIFIWNKDNVTTAWRVLRLRMEETASIYGV